MSLLTKIFGDPNARVVKQLQPLVDATNGHAAAYKALSDADLHGKTAAFRERLAKGETIDQLLPEAFAAVREAGKRTLGQFHYDVQLLGGMVLHRGQIAEMRTGEGKTLTATLAVYLNALTGKGVHVVTVNDYLAKRDAVWMGQIYHALGMSVGVIQHEVAFRYDPDYRVPVEPEKEATGVHEGSEEDKERDTRGVYRVEMSFLRPVPRREAYGADITYGTNNEFGFDYLRDNMAPRTEDMVQRGLHYAIVDEVDSILIDEARTPLIISAPAEESTQLYYRFADLARSLVKDADYNVDEKLRASTFTEAGQEHVAKLLGEDPWVASDVRTVHHLEQALRAEALYRRDKEYVVKDGQVIIVDEFTGRMMHGRRYSEGLHQAIEAKEGVAIQRESRTLATVTFQNLFRLYDKLAGMTGTAATEAEEFSKIYKLEVVQVPTHRPNARVDQVDKIFKTEAGKLKALVAQVKALQEKGQPVLIGTVSIEKNERLSAMLTLEGVPHSVLNAKNHEKEGEIIAQAGRKGAVTVATNMAGRGVDIILGGNPPDKTMADEVRATGGLFVLGTERHESRRIDNQLRGRSARQGDPGVSEFFLSLEDDLMRIFGAEGRIKSVMNMFKVPEDVPIDSKMVAKTIEGAQKRVEGHNFDIRKHLLEYDDVLNRHRETIYKRRRELLEAASQQDVEAGIALLRARVMDMVSEELETVVAFHTSAGGGSAFGGNAESGGDWNFKEIFEVADTIFPVTPATRDHFVPQPKNGASKLQDAELRTAILEALEADAAAAMAMLEKRLPDRVMLRSILRGIMLQAIDRLWMEHLDNMDHLRQGIGLRGYGQRDPLVEYKRESFQMFRQLTEEIQKQIVYSVFKIGQAAALAQEQMRQMQVRGDMTLSGAAKTSDQLTSGNQAAPPTAAPDADKVGRNDPCPCGSGKKFKKCHGA
ncbi:preprotein translocase subunit SecA [Patescibacteria group bacterium]|nr:MAG: preprotein translocase subunit SecA [Patescibacteria group bacterium]